MRIIIITNRARISSWLNETEKRQHGGVAGSLNVSQLQGLTLSSGYRLVQVLRVSPLVFYGFLSKHTRLGGLATLQLSLGVKCVCACCCGNTHHTSHPAFPDLDKVLSEDKKQ